MGHTSHKCKQTFPKGNTEESGQDIVSLNSLKLKKISNLKFITVVG